MSNRILQARILASGVLNEVRNLIAHPRLIAQRLLAHANFPDKGRVVVATNCGLRAMHPPLCCAKRASMPEGARFVSDELWKRTP